jgi:hypothetical protein
MNATPPPLRRLSTALVVAILSLACTRALTAADAAPVVTDPDAFMGDWKGEWTGADGARSPLVAQVIAWGRGEYQANLGTGFDTRDPHLAVLHGRLNGDVVVFDDDTVLSEREFSGTVTVGDEPGEFSLHKVRRLSHTLGLRPPEDAVVLIGRDGPDGWQHHGQGPGVVNLTRLFGGDNRVAYLRNRVRVPEACDAILAVGSDDGIKVWLNGELVHENNVPRGLRRGEDRIPVSLDTGWNRLMLKVSQGGGDWAACAELLGTDGTPLPGLEAESVPANAPTGVRDGIVLAWNAAGPFTHEGASMEQLLNTSFAPESDDDSEVDWIPVNQGETAPDFRWRVLDTGAVEVSGGGSIFSTATFDSHRLHVEFRTPFIPEARGQGRGNSGVYVQGRYEIQVLDSYGLEGLDNECGGIYQISRPIVNMCAPPMQWQTYDITFHAAAFNEQGEKTRNARITVLHNGVPIHTDLELPHPTPGGLDADESRPGAVLFQDHGNPVRFRNVWVQSLDD